MITTKTVFVQYIAFYVFSCQVSNERMPGFQLCTDSKRTVKKHKVQTKPVLKAPKEASPWAKPRRKANKPNVKGAGSAEPVVQ